MDETIAMLPLHMLLPPLGTTEETSDGAIKRSIALTHFRRCSLYCFGCSGAIKKLSVDHFYFYFSWPRFFSQANEHLQQQEEKRYYNKFKVSRGSISICIDLELCHSLSTFFSFWLFIIRLIQQPPLTMTSHQPIVCPLESLD